MRKALHVFAAALLAMSGCSQDDGRIAASGVVEATEVRVPARTAGQVTEVRVEEGDTVVAGQPLVGIDHSTLDLQLLQAAAGLAQAGAQLALLERGARTEDIRQGEEALRQARENLRVAQGDAERMRALFATGSVTQKQGDDADARLVVAQAQAASAAQALKKLQNLARPEELDAARALVAYAEAAVRLVRKSIDDATVRAPIAGVVTHRLVEPGEWAAPGSTLLTVADLSRVRLTIYVPEPDLVRVRLGQEAIIRVDGSPDSYSGRVVTISSMAEFTPKNIQTRDERVKQVFAVKIEVPNPQASLKPGMPADAVLRDQAPGS